MECMMMVEADGLGLEGAPCEGHVEEFMEVCSALGLVGEVSHARGGILWASMKSSNGGAVARFRADGRCGGLWIKTWVGSSVESACLWMLRDMAAGRMSVEVGSRTFDVPPFSSVGELRMKAMMMGLGL